MSGWLIVTLASLVTGLVLQPILIPWLRRRGVMDLPNHRSSHAVATPRGGGIAVLAAVGVGLSVAHVGWQGWAAYLGCIILGGVGLIDDFGGVDAILRLVALFLVGGCAGLLFDSPLPAIAAFPAMGVWAAAYVNAFNFMDGINGISALSGVVAGASYAGMGVTFGSTVLAGLGAALLGACMSFLPYNIPNAKVFLGDVGSYGLGFTIAACAWLAWAGGVPLMLALAPTLLYLADTGWTLFRRASAGAPLKEAHREHAYQRLAASGMSHGAVATLAAALAGLVTASLWLGAVSSEVTLVTLALTAPLLAAYLKSPELVRPRKGPP